MPGKSVPVAVAYSKGAEAMSKPARDPEKAREATRRYQANAKEAAEELLEEVPEAFHPEKKGAVAIQAMQAAGDYVK